MAPHTPDELPAGPVAQDDAVSGFDLGVESGLTTSVVPIRSIRPSLHTSLTLTTLVHHGAPGLYGRRSECNALDRLLDDVSARQSRVLVVRGEAGVGKSALLDYLESKASSCGIARASGVESEMELAFAGVQQLCAPMLDGLDKLPGPQRSAMSTAFGLGTGEAPDRFLVGLAVLRLLSDAADDRPLVCIVDDAQWIDRASTQVLSFVARRLLAESIALVFAVREPRDEHELAGLPEMVVEGIGDVDSRALLEAAVRGRLDEQVRDRIVAETRGNPLALLELPRGLSAAELAGGFGVPHAVTTMTSRMEQSFLRRARSLPHDAQRLLLTAAAEPMGDATLLWRAAASLGIGAGAAVPAVEAGLIELGALARFHHPLVRSAVYHAATLQERQEIHRALADATDPTSDPDRRAWHRARAAVEPDETIARELELSAGRAQARGGRATAAAFLERAVELTPDAARRSARALDAARAKFDAGAPEAAHLLVSIAEIGPLNELQLARLARLRAQLVFAGKRGSDAALLLLGAARKFELLDGTQARETYLEAMGAAIAAGRLGGATGIHEIAEAARRAPPARHPPQPTDLLLDGVATRFTDGFAAGVEPLERALIAFRAQAEHDEDGITRCLWLACPVAPEPIALELWDDEMWQALSTSVVRLARNAGALAVLPVALSYRACMHVHAGEFAAADSLIEECDSITAATGNAPLGYASLVLSAWRGDEARTVKLTRVRVREANASGEGRVIGLAGYVTAVLYNGLGRYEAAFAGAQDGCAYEDPGFFGWSLVELIEAGVRSGARGAAADALCLLEERAAAVGTDWALGSAARARALLSDGKNAEASYKEAIERLGRTRVAVHLARAHLVYGEWLRRENRRVHARAQLRTAYEMLNGIGADAFAERARRELFATGETVRKRSVETRSAFTPQESRIARLAADGYTNSEIGSQLFISARTAEYHLHKIYTKLGISSRRALRDVLNDGARESSLA